VFDLENRRYVFGIHPHGPLPAVAAILIPQLAQFGNRFARLRVAVASVVFALPFVRDFYMAFGAVDAGKLTLTKLLNENYSVAVLPGGEQEQLTVCRPDEEILVLRHRQGFVRLALSCGASLVPVFGFGERECYTQSGFLLSWRQRLVKKYRIAIPLVMGRAPFLLMPKPKPILIVVGKPILLKQELDPSPERVAAVLEQYIAALTELYEQHRHDGAATHKRLVIV